MDTGHVRSHLLVPNIFCITCVDTGQASKQISFSNDIIVRLDNLSFSLIGF